jgi:hypothetical protein
LAEEMKNRDGKNKKHQSVTPTELKVWREHEKMNQRHYRNKSGRTHENHNNKPSCSKTNSPYRSPTTLMKAVTWVTTHFLKPKQLLQSCDRICHHSWNSSPDCTK